MLTDNALKNRFVHYLQQHIELGQEVQRCKDEQPQFLEMAQLTLTDTFEIFMSMRTSIG